MAFFLLVVFTVVLCVSGLASFSFVFFLGEWLEDESRECSVTHLWFLNIELCTRKGEN